MKVDHTKTASVDSFAFLVYFPLQFTGYVWLRTVSRVKALPQEEVRYAHLSIALAVLAHRSIEASSFHGTHPNGWDSAVWEISSMDFN